MGARLSLTLALMLLSMTAGVYLVWHQNPKPDPPAPEKVWIAPDSSTIPGGEEGMLILYGRTLITQTAVFFGPQGMLSHDANGMNCQNCHLRAGTQPFGNNYGAVYANYPRYRNRRGANETVIQRITDCFERSLNGKAPDSASREMQAMLAYMNWLGQGVAKGQKAKGSGLTPPDFLDRAADSAKGRSLYALKCERCHGPDGQGTKSADSVTYTYPPLWGDHSYNTAAGLYRVGKFAAYVQNNMPFGADYKSPQLTGEEAWDLAAFVNSQPRPAVVFPGDYPKLYEKDPDHPFGPYADTFTERQHKYGPFKPIKKFQDSLTNSLVNH